RAKRDGATPPEPAVEKAFGLGDERHRGEDLARPRDAPGIAVVDERGDQEDGDVDAVTARAVDEGPLGGGVSDERPAHDRRIALLEPPLPYLSQALQPALDDHREGRRRGQRQREPG